MKKKHGYTLIELLTVFSIIAVITSITLASFSSIKSTQANSDAVDDFVSLLQQAKSSALSQVKPSDCYNQTLGGYQVVITSTNMYELDYVCGSVQHTVTKHNLPSQVYFANTSSSRIFFTVPGGTVSAPATVTIISNGNNKNITVNSSGTISEK